LPNFNAFQLPDLRKFATRRVIGRCSLPIRKRAVTSLKITYKDPAQLKPRARNPRTHTAKQIRQIQASIKEFGFINPVLIDGTNGIIAGHGRLEAAKLVGMRDVPTVRVDHLTAAQIRAYVIADNKLAENAGWDRELLTLELQELSVELNLTSPSPASRPQRLISL